MREDFTRIEGQKIMQQLFEKEKEIMEIIWGKAQPCLISDILKENPELSRNTVAKALVTLEKKGFLKIDGVRKTVTRSGRTYVAAVSEAEYDLQMKLLACLEESQSVQEYVGKMIDLVSAIDEIGSGIIGTMKEKLQTK